MPPPASQQRSELSALGRSSLAKVVQRIVSANQFTHSELKSFHDWSNPGRESWLSTSQISALRTGKLSAPGPKIFEAVANINLRLASIADSLMPLNCQLPEVTDSAKHIERFKDRCPVFVVNPITELPLNAGDVFMVFLGYLDPNIQEHGYSDRHAQMVSARMALYIQSWMLEEKLLPIQAKPVLLKAYAGPDDRAEKFWFVVMGGHPYTGEELGRFEFEIMPVWEVINSKSITIKSWEQFVSTGVFPDSPLVLA